MSLKLSRLQFENFRSYPRLSLDGLGDLNILHGPNASGKTNVLEGIYLLCTQSSFRKGSASAWVHTSAGSAFYAPSSGSGLGVSLRAREGNEAASPSFGQREAEAFDSAGHGDGDDAEFHMEGAACMRISLEAEGDGRSISLAMNMANGKKLFFYQGKASSPSKLKGVLPCVVFTPDDLGLAKGSSSVRRNELDFLGAQLSSNHYVIARDYAKLLRQKNSLLKEGASSLLIESVNDVMAVCGASLIAYRSALLKRLEQSISSFYEEISAGHEKFSTVYVASWNRNDAGNSSEFQTMRRFAVSCTDAALPDCGQGNSQSERDSIRRDFESALKQQFSHERERGRCLVGPHLDGIFFYLNGRATEYFASQGQQRSVALALKLAEAQLIFEHLRQRPLLLLDDVMSELDASRRKALVRLGIQHLQTFITATDIDSFDCGLTGDAHLISLPL